MKILKNNLTIWLVKKVDFKLHRHFWHLECK